MAEKNRAADPAMRGRHRLMSFIWVNGVARRLLGAGGPGLPISRHGVGRTEGVAAGRFGAYRRSRRRMALRKAAHLR